MSGEPQSEMTAHELTAARLAVEHATAGAVRLLREAGIDPIVLRGPALARVLYPESGGRASVDVDLLVPDLEVASAGIEAAGYQVVVDWTPGVEKHAWTHVRENSISIDLHRTIVGATAPAARVWETFDREHERTILGSEEVRAPSAALSAVIVALHAAQHGAASAKTTADLERALQVFDRETWRRGSEIARHLGAESAFAAGLELVPAGAGVASPIGIEAAPTVTAELRAGDPDPTALGLDHLLQQEGARARARFLLHKAFPPAAFMRDWKPIARRGPLGLCAAYVYRLGWLARWLPSGIAQVVRARRAAGGG